MTGMIAAAISWQASLAVLAVLSAAVATALWAWLPVERRARRNVIRTERSPMALFQHPQLVASYAVGFCVLCSQVAIFTYVPFPLAAPPFNLSTAALGWIFAVYLVGAVVTPFAGRWIDLYGPRVALGAAVSIGIVGALVTTARSLPVIIAGLSVFATGVFVAQASATSHVGANAEEDRGLAIGLYSSFYYLGGSVGGAIPALAWARAGWPGCVALVIGVQLTTLAIALTTWSSRPGAHAEPAPV